MSERVDRLFPDRIRGRFGAKFAAVGLAVVLVVSLISGVAVTNVDDTLRSNTEADLQASAQAKAALLDNWLGTLESEATLLTRTDAVANGDTHNLGGWI